MQTATGGFDVTMTPAPDSGDGPIDRFLLDKAYKGDLVGTGRGQMLASTTAVDGSAGYVAIEHIEATVSGREGSFVVQHFGLMERGSAKAQIPIIPDSGTGALTGIGGNLTIDVDEEGNHLYRLSFRLAD